MLYHLLLTLMALYHYSAQIISRSAGKSAVAAAAYRAGEKLWDERYGKQYDYRKKQGVAHSEILLPVGAPVWMSERQMLWNQIEAIEKHPRAQLCREFTVALQSELSVEQNLELLQGFLQEQFVSRGIVIDLAVHYPIDQDKKADELCQNPHAHVMYPLRQVVGDGFGNKLRGTFSEHQAELLAEREAWAKHVNAALAKAGIEERVDHRSLAEQGIERLPQIHLGVHAHGMRQKALKKRCELPERAELLAAILQQNAEQAVKAQALVMAEEAEESPTGWGGQLGVMESMEQPSVDALDNVADDLDLTKLTGESEASDAVLSLEDAALPTEGWGESEVIVSAVIDADLAESVRADDGAVSASDALAETLPEEVIEPMPVACADKLVQPVKPVNASESATTQRQASVIRRAAPPPNQSAEADLVEQVALVQPDLIAPVPVAQDSCPPQGIGATSAEKTNHAQALSETAPAQLQIEQVEQITWLLKTASAKARQFPGHYDFSAVKEKYKVEFGEAGRQTLTRVEGQVLIDQGRPTAGLGQRDWEFFKAWKDEFMRQDARRRAVSKTAGKKPQQRRMDGR